MRLLNRLREETAELHRKLEGENLANKIMDHTIDIEEYKLLLYQNFQAYCTVEKQLSRFIPVRNKTKSESLEQDLLGLGLDKPQCDNFSKFSCENEAEAIGAAYVIEGSAMGGMVIGKELKNCESLKDLPIQNFFSGNRDSMKGWNDFLKFLRSREFSEKEQEQAGRKAQETFKLFGKAFELEFSDYQNS